MLTHTQTQLHIITVYIYMFIQQLYIQGQKKNVIHWVNQHQAAALATAALVLRRKRTVASTASTALRAVEPEVVDTEEGPVAEMSWKIERKIGWKLEEQLEMDMKWKIHGQFIEYV